MVASTGVYALATTPPATPSLVLAADVMGTLFGLQRRASGGLQAPLLTHLTWSTLMVRYLPPLFRTSHEETQNSPRRRRGRRRGRRSRPGGPGLRPRADRPAGSTCVVLEGGDAVGGRVRTDHVDGFTLDRGFQVLNTAYPELRAVVDLDALDLRAFDSSVAVQLDGERVDASATRCRARSTAAVHDRRPGRRAPRQGRVGLYAGLCVTPAGRLLQRRDDVSAAEAWRRANIPPDVVNGLLRPFFSGVLLEQDLSTSRRFTDLMMRMFARGRSTVPARRHAAAAEQIAADLPAGTLRLDSRVHQVGPAGCGRRTP